MESASLLAESGKIIGLAAVVGLAAAGFVRQAWQSSKIREQMVNILNIAQFQPPMLGN
jgi:hypothetical protein